MAHFAKTEDTDNANFGVVVQVAVAEQDFILTGAMGDPDRWIKTSYNTRGGVHYDPVTGEPSEDQSKALRGNYAGIGYLHDRVNDVFIAPQPYASWTLNKTTWTWESPVAYPTDGKLYTWNEENLSWNEIIPQNPASEEAPVAA